MIRASRHIQRENVEAISRNRDLRHESALQPLFMLILFFAWLLVAVQGNLFAQEQKKGPTSLELPDVIVYGVETGFRETGEKVPLSRVASPETPLNEIDPYPSFPAPEVEHSLPPLKGSVTEATTSLSSYVGLYSSWGLQAAHISRVKQARIRFLANLEGTDGAYDNSGGTWGEIAGKIYAPLSRKISGGLQAGYRRWSYGLYGITMYDPTEKELYNSEYTRGKSRHEVMSIDSFMDYIHSENTSSRLKFAFQRLTFSPDFYFERYENLFQSDFSLLRTIGSARIMAKATWTGSRLSIEDITPPADVNLVIPDFPSSDFLSLNIMARIPLLPRFSADLGGDLQAYSRDRRARRTRFFPGLKLIFRPFSSAAVYGSMGGSFRHHSMASLLEENPYADPMISSTAEEVLWHVDAGGELQVNPALLLRGRYRYETVRDELYWQWSFVTYMKMSLDEVRQHHFDISVRYQPGGQAQVEAGISFLDYELEDRLIPISDASPEIPFRPKSQAWGNVFYAIPGIIDIRSDWKWVGKRTSFLPTHSDELIDVLKLDPYFLLNVTLEKQIQDHITLFTSFYNLLDNKYEVWYDYPEMGLTLHGGVKVIL